MFINLSNINFYFLTLKTNCEKSKHILDILKDMKVTEITAPTPEIGKQKSGTIGHFQMIEQGLKDQDSTKPFQPFIILEDDVSLLEDLPITLDIPNNTDILYTGISACALGHNKDWWNPADHLDAYDIDDKYVKIHNMLSTHSIMICSPLGASIYMKCMCSNYYQNGKGWDIYLAKMQPHYNVYALKIPIFYQDKKYGGEEWATKISLENNKIIYHSDCSMFPTISKIYKSYNILYNKHSFLN